MYYVNGIIILFLALGLELNKPTGKNNERDNGDIGH